jgi:site-specific recombinase XerD
MRRSEIGNLSVEDVDIDQQIVRVVGKGNKVRYVPFGDRAATALDRYLRLRRTHRYAGLPHLWLSERGSMTGQGVAWVVERRAGQAGLGHVHAHQFRHTFAHQQKMAGVPDEVIERTAGWAPASPMLRRYGAAAADERARDAYRRYRAPGDRL